MNIKGPRQRCSSVFVLVSGHYICISTTASFPLASSSLEPGLYFLLLLCSRLLQSSWHKHTQLFYYVHGVCESGIWASIAGMAWFCSSPGKAWTSGDWRKRLENGIIRRFLHSQMWNLAYGGQSVGPPHVVWGSSQHDSLGLVTPFTAGSFSKQGRSFTTFCILALEVSQCYFYRTLLVQTVISRPWFKGGWTEIPTCWWEECQKMWGHVIKLIQTGTLIDIPVHIA